MSVHSTRWKLALVGAVCYAAVAWYFGGNLPRERKAAAQEGEKAAPKKGPVDEKGNPLPKLYFGTKACGTAGCHEKGQKADPPLLCRCDELDRWRQQDKHSEAFNVLRGPRGKQMAKILGYDVTKAKECLTCHSAYISDDKSRHSTFRHDEGVSCVICHGAYERWVGAHSLALSREEFRVKDRSIKEKNYGMTDLWNPARRTRLCVSCHIGNAAEGKFISHEMYAAGHPPLPSVEIATFDNEMPRHWQLAREKPDAVVAIQKLDKNEFEQTRLVLVSAAVSFAESMNLLAAEAGKVRRATNGLDYSNFDCYACHHDLKSPSWRQKRGYKGKPGRVPMRPWSTELVRLALDFLGDAGGKREKELDKGIANLDKAFTARPFGDPAAIEKAASKLAAWGTALADELAGKGEGYKKILTEKDARRLLQRIPKKYLSQILDYDSARQVAWALKVIYNELLFNPKNPSEPKKGDPEIDKLLSALDRELFLTLYNEAAVKTAKKPRIIEPDLEKRLDKVNAYDPDRFRNIFRRLSTSLSKKEP